LGGSSISTNYVSLKTDRLPPIQLVLRFELIPR